MQTALCKICGHRHQRSEPHIWPGVQAAPEAPRSNAQSPSPDTQDTAQCTTGKALPSTVDDQTLGKPDSEPSPQTLTDEELAPYYNEHMRRKMRSWRKAKK